MCMLATTDACGPHGGPADGGSTSCLPLHLDGPAALSSVLPRKLHPKHQSSAMQGPAGQKFSLLGLPADLLNGIAAHLTLTQRWARS